MVEAAEVRPSEYVLWDGDIPGFGVRVMPSGRKGYLVQYRVGTRSRKLALGSHGVLTVDQARARAIQALADVKGGGDPAEVRKERREAITVRELAERFDREHVAVRVKESTAKEYRRNLKRFILPALGRLRVTDVSRADVAKFHHSLRHIPYQANRNLEIVSKMFSLAEMWGLRPEDSNPRKHLAKYTEHKRERFLSPAELKRLGETLNEMEAERVELPAAITAVRLLLLTGCRLNEIMKLRWEHVDLSDAVLRLPDSKTGAKVVHLGQAAVEVLAAIERQPFNPHVIVGTLPGQRLSDLQPFWRRVRARAGIKDVRIHDMRHTFASVAVASGQGLPMIGKLLGHSQVQTTARYAHLAGDAVRQAANDVADVIAGRLG
jgi:integrase